MSIAHALAAPGSSRKTVLVIGITGGVGYETAEALIARGFNVVALHRDPDAARRTLAFSPDVRWIAGDAMNGHDVERAVAGCDAILHAANPPGYRNWRGLALPMLENAIAAARKADVRLILPGNIYNYGPDAWPLVSEDSPQNPVTEKGQVRVEMEAALARHCRNGGRALIVRAGDFFGRHAPASWMHTVMAKPGKPIRSVTWPGDRTTGHAFAYLPDLAETIVRLLELEDQLAPFERVHFSGHWLEPGFRFAEALSEAAGGVPVKQMPWGLLRVVALFHRTLREAMAMRYLWQEPVRLDNGRLHALLGDEPHTPLTTAVQDSLIGVNALPAAADASGAGNPDRQTDRKTGGKASRPSEPRMQTS